jgi:hypothetical protein
MASHVVDVDKTRPNFSLFDTNRALDFIERSWMTEGNIERIEQISVMLVGREGLGLLE